MISPRSYVYYSGAATAARSPPSTPPSTPNSAATATALTPTITSTTLRPLSSSSPSSHPHPTTPLASSTTTTTTTNSYRGRYTQAPRQHLFQRPRQSNLPPPSAFPPQPSASPSAPPANGPITINTTPRRIHALKHDNRKPSAFITIESIPSASLSASPEIDAIMGKRRDRTSSPAGLSPPSPPSSTGTLTRPATPTGPVKIPKNSHRPSAHPQKRHTGTRRGLKNVYSTDDISPSVAALLAMTDIPRPGQSQRRRKRIDKPLTVDDIFDEPQVSEKELSISLSRSPLDILLSPPEEATDDDLSLSDCNLGPALMARTVSVDSMPSLGESFATDTWSSVESPGAMGSSLRGRRFSPMRRSLEPIISPPGEDHMHPLAGKPAMEDDILDALEQPSVDPIPSRMDSFKPLKFAFKSNLTASLRALRSAAKSFSTINFTSIPSEDLITQSLLNMDTRVPYADERRPPVTEDLPSAEIRRYLNPMSSSRIETQPAPVQPPGKFSASIQMQTYKVHRSKHNASGNAYPRTSPQLSTPEEEATQTVSDESASFPAPRQREVRENSDFIRIAVMEMAMRKRGKLDDHRPGRARWSLPPRKMATAPYVIGANGVPARWRSITY